MVLRRRPSPFSMLLGKPYGLIVIVPLKIFACVFVTPVKIIPVVVIIILVQILIMLSILGMSIAGVSPL